MMRFDVPGAWERREITASPRFCLSGVLRQAIVVLGIALGATLALGLTLYYRPALSEGQTSAFQSPLYPVQDDPPLSTPGDLLTNGNMDLESFYWRYPNHWIAGSWFEWFSTEQRIPEFTDGNERYLIHSKPSSQRLQLWGGGYAGGLMQSVTVTPCTYYRLRVFGQSRPGSDNPPPVSVSSHMKVGLEPHGWLSDRSLHNYDPGLEPRDFPTTVVWSPEKTSYFAFAPYELTTEALSDTVTAIMYSKPGVDLKAGVWWHDTVWDSASLIEVQPPGGTILNTTHIPATDGFIANLSVMAYPYQSIIEWDTLEPASSQVIYKLVDKEPVTPSGSTLLFQRVYLPFATQMSHSLREYSPLDSTPTLHHKVVLPGMPAEYTIELVALSRRLEGQTCVTSVSERVLMAARDETHSMEE